MSVSDLPYNGSLAWESQQSYHGDFIFLVSTGAQKVMVNMFFLKGNHIQKLHLIYIHTSVRNFVLIFFVGGGCSLFYQFPSPFQRLY